MLLRLWFFSASLIFPLVDDAKCCLYKLPDGGMDWVGKTGSCSGGQGLALGKARIQLSADGWDCAPSLLVVWPEVTQLWGL